MLDVNLPTFFLESNARQKHHSNLFFTQYGSDLEPAYSLRHLDPAVPSSKNLYAVAICDAYTPDILFGEVLIVPEWTQPTPAQETIRQNGGPAPPPEPILPAQFMIQLYNPDQKVVVRYRPKTWNSAQAWEFEMPMQTFRQPSNSTLDHTQNDPAASDVTPKLKFIWKKESALSKDFACYLSGKTTMPNGHKKNKEPDIPISIFKGFKEITLYEPNLCRAEMEDSKGREVVLILSAMVIRDVFFGQLKDVFHTSDSPSLSPTAVATPTIASWQPLDRPPINGQPVTGGEHSQDQKLQVQPTTIQEENEPAPVDARTKPGADAENARLRQQQAAEARARRKRDKEQEKKTMKLLAAEEKEARKKQAEIDKETARLNQAYNHELPYQAQQQSPPSTNATSPNLLRKAFHHRQQQTATATPESSPHMRVPSGPENASRRRSSLTKLPPRPLSTVPQPLREKRSIFGFRKNHSDDHEKQSKLIKKKSMML